MHLWAQWHQWCSFTYRIKTTLIMLRKAFHSESCPPVCFPVLLSISSTQRDTLEFNAFVMPFQSFKLFSFKISLTHRLFRNMLFSFYTFGDFPATFLLLMSRLIPLRPGNILCMVSFFFYYFILFLNFL